MMAQVVTASLVEQWCYNTVTVAYLGLKNGGGGAPRRAQKIGVGGGGSCTTNAERRSLDEALGGPRAKL